MSHDREIGAPFTLASLPQAIRKSDGHAQAASVCSISGVKKKKRSEVAVGLDGEGISIYSLQNPRLVSSYALPPQTSIASVPYSVYRKGSTKRSPLRYTYAFVGDASSNGKSQLICFAEKIHKDTSSDTVKTTYTPSTSSQTAIAIDSIPVLAGGSQKDATHDVVAVFDSGEVVCLSASLDVVRWVANVNALAHLRNESLELQFACLSTARAVVHGLLRNRQDIVATLNIALDDKSDMLDLTQVLCVVSRQADNKNTMGLFQVQPRSTDLPTNQLTPVKHLLTWDIPAPSPTTPSRPDSATYSLHANVGTLVCLTESALLSYDFSGIVPKLTSEIPASICSVTSFLRISQDLLFTASIATCQILDTKYTSIQAERSLDSLLTVSASSPSKKRKSAASLSDSHSDILPTLVAYYSDLGLAVGIWKDEVVGFQLNRTSTRKRAKIEGTRLIDSLGKGLSAQVGGQRLPHDKESKESQKWQERVAKLNKYATKGKVARFEEHFAADLGIELEKDPRREQTATTLTKNSDNNDAIANGTAVDGSDPSGDAQTKTEDVDEDIDIRKWKFNQHDINTQGPRRRMYAFYALGKIFRWVDASAVSGQPGRLSIEFFPPNVFQWLLYAGYLTKESIRRALLDSSSNELRITTAIRDGDIVRAVVDYDPELHLLSAMLNDNHFLPVGEVVQAVKLIMQSLDEQPKTEHRTKLLTNGTDLSADAMDIDIDTALEAADHEIDLAISMLDNGVVVRADTLRPALIRLHTFPSSAISSSLRSMLSRNELESLIRLLHHEFRNGGWGLAFDFVESEPTLGDSLSAEVDDSAVAIIASLLSCALDAVGQATWLTAVNDETTEELVHNLSEDTQVAITGFWEASYLVGLIDELLRYASKVNQSQKPSNRTLEAQGKPFALDTDELCLLPMGSKPEMGIERTKAGKGGKRRERSAREIGMLISKQVPKYVFERITI